MLFCRKRGQQSADSAGLCTQSGAEAGNATDRETAESAQTSPVIWKKLNLKMVLITAGCVLAVCAVFVPVLINAALNDRYQQACDLMDAGDAAKAKAVFLELGAFEDAKSMAQECQSIIDYNAAKQMMDNERFADAEKAFAALGGFEDAEKMAEECRNTIEYNSAVLLKESGKLEQAKNAFLALGNFQDAAQMARDCQNELDYNAAVALMETGQYEQAKQIFDSLDKFWDSSTLSSACRNHMDYSAAELALNNKEYHDAYRLFSSLNGFSDAAERALACVQPNPDNGELYRNPDFGSKACSVTIKVGDTGESLYLKIFTPDDVLVSTVFVASGQKTKIKLPTGSFRMKAAYGVEWFGETDMFGDDGYYEVLIFEDGTDIDTLSSKYIYTLSFLQQEGNIGGMNVGNEDF